MLIVCLSFCHIDTKTTGVFVFFSCVCCIQRQHRSPVNCLVKSLCVESIVVVESVPVVDNKTVFCLKATNIDLLQNKKTSC